MFWWQLTSCFIFKVSFVSLGCVAGLQYQYNNNPCFHSISEISQFLQVPIATDWKIILCIFQGHLGSDLCLLMVNTSLSLYLYYPYWSSQSLGDEAVRCLGQSCSRHLRMGLCPISAVWPCVTMHLTLCAQGWFTVKFSSLYIFACGNLMTTVISLYRFSSSTFIQQIFTECSLCAQHCSWYLLKHTYTYTHTHTTGDGQ